LGARREKDQQCAPELFERQPLGSEDWIPLSGQRVLASRRTARSGRVCLRRQHHADECNGSDALAPGRNHFRPARLSPARTTARPCNVPLAGKL